VLCDEGIHVGLKGNVYRIVVRLALLQGSECWLTTRTQVQMLTVVEMRMIQWICGHMRFDRIKNEAIKDKANVASIEDKMRNTGFKWGGHVDRSMDSPI